MTPILAIAGCLWIIKDLHGTVVSFVVWTVLAVVFYFTYSIRNSKLSKNHGTLTESSQGR